MPFNFRTHPVFSIPDSRQRLLCYNGSNKNTHTRQLKSKPNHMRLGNLLKCRAVNDNVAAEEEKKEDISQATLLWRAVKLPIYSVALVPLTVSALFRNVYITFSVTKLYVFIHNHFSLIKTRR